MNDHRLDEVLHAALDEPEDAGFSRRTLQAIIAAERRRDAQFTAGCAAALAVLMALLPSTGFGDWLLRATPYFSQSEPVLLACAALVLTTNLLRFLPE